MGGTTIIFTGDLHGHLVPRPDVLSVGPRWVGGLARVATVIESIRRRAPDSLLVNAGDTIHGSAEALLTRGQALVDVLNRFGIDAFAPGNWDFMYGTNRFLELFAGTEARAPWHALAANLYYDGEPYADRTGSRVLPPYRTVTIGAYRIGLLGLTTHRGPQAMGRQVTRGFRFGDGDAELDELIPQLRGREAVDLLVLISELGLARNIQLARRHPGVDVVLSSDTHELTRRPVRLDNGTLLVEPGQDGIVVGELRLRHDSDAGWLADWTAHEISDAVLEDPIVAAAIAEVRRPFLSADIGPDRANRVGRGAPQPIDTAIGSTSVALHRAGPSQSALPAVIEGSSHDLIVDALRAATGADVASLRGFRFGTHVAPGPVRWADLYHFLPLGSSVGSGRVMGKHIRAQLENAADGCLAPDPKTWTGGWMFAYSGLRATLDPLARAGRRIVSADVQEPAGEWHALEDEREYRYAALYHPQAPGILNGLQAADVELLRDGGGQVLDATEVVAAYLASRPSGVATVTTGRIRLAAPLPLPVFGNPELQPLAGVGPAPSGADADPAAGAT